MKKDYLLLREIKLPGLGSFYPPIVKDILELNENELRFMLFPFLISKDNIELDGDKEKVLKEKLGENYTIFDYILFEEHLKVNLILALQYFYKTTETYPCVDYLKSYCIIKDSKGNPSMISNDNWDELCTLIKDVMWMSNAKQEKREVTIQDESNRAILEEYLRLEEQAEEEKRKLAEKNRLSLHDVVTIVAKDCSWDYDRVHNMTYYQLYNSFYAISIYDKFETDMKYHTSYKFDTTDMKIEHWIDGIRKGV